MFSQAKRKVKQEKNNPRYQPQASKMPPVSSLVASLLVKSMGNYHKLPLTSPVLKHHLKGFSESL